MISKKGVMDYRLHILLKAGISYYITLSKCASIGANLWPYALSCCRDSFAADRT